MEFSRKGNLRTALLTLEGGGRGEGKVNTVLEDASNEKVLVD